MIWDEQPGLAQLCRRMNQMSRLVAGPALSQHESPPRRLPQPPRFSKAGHSCCRNRENPGFFPQPRTNKNSGFVTNDLYCGYEKHILVACAGSSMAIRSVNRFAKACIPSRTCGRRITSCFPIFCLQALIPEYFASRHGIAILLSSINPIF